MNPTIPTARRWAHYPRLAILGAAAAIALLGAGARPADAEAPPLIPRDVFFGESERENPQISPDGTRIAYLGRSTDGIANIWLRTLDADDDTTLTHLKRSIPSFEWAPDGKQILFFQDRGGDENTHLYLIEVATGAVRDLTPFPGVRAQELITSPDRPREVLVGLNQRNPSLFDIHRVDLKTGSVRLDTQNPGDVIAWTADRALVVRAATVLDAKTGDTVIRVRDSARAPWRDLLRWPFAEAGNDIYQRGSPSPVMGTPS
jgi:dipeptidyl aminopeptidase/acylaminoacyl peptidase